MVSGLVFGYGQKADGSLDDQTRDRCIAALKVYNRGAIERIVITVGVKKNGILMANAMRDFFCAHGVVRAHVVVIPRGINTAGEMDTLLPFLQNDETVVFISTWYHLPRIVYLALWRLSWRRFAVVAAWRHAHPVKDVLMEFLKLGNAIIRPLAWSKILPPASI